MVRGSESDGPPESDGTARSEGERRDEHAASDAARSPDHETGALPDVETEPLGGDVVGTLHLPPEPPAEPVPGVLLLHGSGGRPMDRRARCLADRGFAAASVQYFGEPDPLPDDLAEVPVEYVAAASERLRAHDRVRDGGVGVLGVSKGGELALLAGAHLDDVHAVVSVSGSGVVWEGLTAEWQPTGTSSWSLDGDPVPYVPFPSAAGGSTIRENYEIALSRASEETVEAATIPLEDADAAVVAVSGTDDQLWDAVGLTDRAFDRLGETARTTPSEHLVYEDAGHGIEPPRIAATRPEERAGPPMGGTPDGNERANREHWPEVLTVLETALGD